MAFPDLQFISDAPAIAPDGFAALEGRMALMLSALKPRSDAEALRLLRANFPESSLAQRMAALAQRRAKP